MKDGLCAGERFSHRYLVPPDKTVRHLYPESDDFAAFPEVFATGFMVGLMELACVRAMAPYLEPGEGSLGTAICVTHTAATPPGLTVTVDVELLEVQKRRLSWRVTAHDGVDQIGSGTHERAVITLDRFKAKVEEKAASAQLDGSGPARSL
jgi:fluoroacetyl-CoA thioesterase